MVTLVLPEGLSAEDVVALTLIANERARQRTVEGFDDAHDDGHAAGVLANGAACYALNAAATLSGERTAGHRLVDFTIEWLWPRDRYWWKPKSPIRDMERAGALLVGELARGVRFTNRGGAVAED